MRFIGRKNELKTLNEQYRKPQAYGSPMVIIYGRRRVGKSTLIGQFAADKPALTFLASQETSTSNLQNFVKQIAEQAGLPYAQGLSINNWYDAFQFYADTFLNDRVRHVLIIDEFPYLVQSDKAFPSIMQRVWDTGLKDKNMMLILCGSHESMMLSSVLSHESPLYGRRSAQIKLLPFSFREFSDAFPAMAFEDSVRLYALTGGIPKYMEEFNGSTEFDFYKELKDKVLNANSMLYLEPEFLLKSDSAGNANQMTLLKTIAGGAHKMSEIAAKMEVRATDLSFYLKNLTDIGYIRREIPVTEKNPAKSKMGLYFINDSYIDFWFKFVYPYRGSIDLGRTDRVENIVKRDYDMRHSAFVYERICLEVLLDYCDSRDDILMPERFGRYWDSGKEIDVVAIDDTNKRAFVGECKFHNEPVGLEVLSRLHKKYTEIKELQGYTPIFGLFSKSGFTSGIFEALKESDNILLFDKDLIVS